MGRRAESSRRTPVGPGACTRKVGEASCGARRRRSRNASCLKRMKEGRNGVRSRAAARFGQNCRGRKRGGGASRPPRSERSWGQRESNRVSSSAGWGWPRRGGVAGLPAPQSQEAGNREAALLAERQGRREAPDGLGAPPAGCGGSRSQSGARAQTSGRQRTPATGPQGPRGGARVAGPGAGPGRGYLGPAQPGSGPRGPRPRPCSGLQKPWRGAEHQRQFFKSDARI